MKMIKQLCGTCHVIRVVQENGVCILQMSEDSFGNTFEYAAFAADEYVCPICGNKDYDMNDTPYWIHGDKTELHRYAKRVVKVWPTKELALKHEQKPDHKIWFHPINFHYEYVLERLEDEMEDRGLTREDVHPGFVEKMSDRAGCNDFMDESFWVIFSDVAEDMLEELQKQKNEEEENAE
jgi:hypothetical protein